MRLPLQAIEDETRDEFLGVLVRAEDVVATRDDQRELVGMDEGLTEHFA